MPSIERLKALQVEHFCDDIEIDEERMIPWSDAQAVRFFESGGADAGDDEIVPCGFPAKWSLFHVSDLHVEHKSNLAWLDTLPDGTPPTMPVPTYVPGKPAQEVAGAGSGVRATPGSVLLCCGDVATEPELLRHSLRAMRRAYETVFFVPGNHDVWTKGPQAGQRAQDSLDKYRRLLQICVEEGVKTAPERLGDAHASATGSSSDGASGGASTPVGGLWVVPIASWYHSSWDREPPLRVPPGMQYAATPRQRHAASDDACCHWPRQMANGSDDVARALDALNDEAPTVHGAGVGGDEGARPAAGAPKGPLSFPAALEAIEQERAACAAAGTALPVVLSCSHFLPRQELLPEKRHLFMPTLHEIVGSDPLRARVDRLRPTAHCFGHTVSRHALSQCRLAAAPPHRHDNRCAAAPRPPHHTPMYLVLYSHTVLVTSVLPLRLDTRSPCPFRTRSTSRGT